jgi:rare lipoprotein A (peptidoglycan hydrolase)
MLALLLSWVSEARASPRTVQVGLASFYGYHDGFAGRKTASGERFNPMALTAASGVDQQ